MEILLWLLPAACATVVAMGWAAWWGREGRGEVDRETAARRLGEALARERGVRPGYAAERRPAERSGAVAVRASEPVEVIEHAEPVEVAGESPEPVAEPVSEPVSEPVAAPEPDEVREIHRRAS